jgi:hypothetical protein
MHYKITLSSARTGNPLTKENADKREACFVIPESERLGTMHIMLAVTDDGTPKLTRYQHLIIHVTE